LKILLTSHRFYPDIGGIESISSVLADFFTRSGHSVCLVTQTCTEPSSDRQCSYRILRCPTSSQLVACFQWADVVLQNNLEVRQLWPLLVCRKPLVIGLQTWLRTVKGRRTIVQQIKLIALRTANQLIACSNAVRLDCSPRATVIGNPYNNALFRLAPGVERRQKIAFLGRLVSDKGADMLLRAFAALHPSQWRLTIIGDGPERAGLEALANDLGVRHSIDFLGSLEGEALMHTLNEHEILVVPSLWREPFGIVALEGMACGCALLASDGGGLPDAVGSAGLLFRRGDQTDLNSKLLLLSQDSYLREQLRERSTMHLQAFQQEVVCKRYLTLLEHVTAGATKC
jgi:glycosyltransferase involved in cell wall biosynthesis